jgi:hypothetical protein
LIRGGILLEADQDVFEIRAIDEVGFYVKLILRDKSDGFKFSFYGIYGPAQQNRKRSVPVRTCAYRFKGITACVIGEILIL